MNDFTKEELVSIAYALQCCGLINSQLRIKILSMIDNYCDHEKATTINPGDTVLICNQCETILDVHTLRKFNSHE